MNDREGDPGLVSKPPPMRVRMPGVAAFIDAMREAFGREGVDASIRAGMAGGEGFYAEEGGLSVGTPLAAPVASYVYLRPDRWERRNEEGATG